MEKKLTKAAKKQQEREAKKRNLLAYTLQSLTQCQTEMPEVKVLKDALETLHQLPNKTEEHQELDEMLSVAIAYKQDNFSDRATAAVQQLKQILILDNEQNLILKESIEGKIEYHGIVFTLKRVRAAYNRTYALKAENENKLAEQNRAKVLAQIPANFDAKVKALQQQAEQHWDKLSLFNPIDLKFLEGYKCRPSFNFYKVVNANIQTYAQMNDWIGAWIERVETAVAAPSLVDVSTQTILELIADSPKFGIQTYAMWLGNSKAKNLEKRRLNKTFRAALGDYSIVAIATKIEAYVDYQWLTIIAVGAHKLPVLKLTKRGKKVLQLLIQKKIKIVEPEPEPVKVVDVHSHIHWLKQIQQQEHTAYVDFLNTPQSIANIAMWTEDEIVAMQLLLNERLKDWQVLATWKLRKHPATYKPLQRLLC